jgi:hypothetical protein
LNQNKKDNNKLLLVYEYLRMLTCVVCQHDDHQLLALELIYKHKPGYLLRLLKMLDEITAKLIQDINDFFIKQRHLQASGEFVKAVISIYRRNKPSFNKQTHQQILAEIFVQKYEISMLEIEHKFIYTKGCCVSATDLDKEQ